MLVTELRFPTTNRPGGVQVSLPCKAITCMLAKKGCVSPSPDALCIHLVVQCRYVVMYSVGLLRRTMCNTRRQTTLPAHSPSQTGALIPSISPGPPNVAGAKGGSPPRQLQDMPFAHLNARGNLSRQLLPSTALIVQTERYERRSSAAVSLSPDASGRLPDLEPCHR